MATIIFVSLFVFVGIALLIMGKKLANKAEKNTSQSSYNNNDVNYAKIALTSRIAGAVVIIVGFLMLVLNIAKTTNSGTVKVAKVFGKIQRDQIYEGLSLVNPIADWTEMNIQRNSITAEDGSGDPGMTSTTADNNTATVGANFNYSVNSDYAWWVLKYLGPESKFRTELLEKSAQSATRDALGHYKLEEAQIKKRTEFEAMLTEEFAKNIVAGLPQKELSANELKNVFKIYPTQLMSVKPDNKVANALAEKKATEILLEQQKTLTDIENERAKRKKAEGVGIRNMFDELPQKYSAGDVALILNASANKTRAEAMMKAVTDGKVNFGVFEGESARTAK